MKGRDREAIRIQKANKAVAVVKLVNGDFNNWAAFLEPDFSDLTRIPRRNLKAGYADVRGRLANEIKEFCSKNFENMTEDDLGNLYEEIKKKDSRPRNTS